MASKAAKSNKEENYIVWPKISRTPEPELIHRPNLNQSYHQFPKGNSAMLQDNISELLGMYLRKHLANETDEFTTSRPSNVTDLPDKDKFAFVFVVKGVSIEIMRRRYSIPTHAPIHVAMKENPSDWKFLNNDYSSKNETRGIPWTNENELITDVPEDFKFFVSIERYVTNIVDAEAQRLLFVFRERVDDSTTFRTMFIMEIHTFGHQHPKMPGILKLWLRKRHMRNDSNDEAQDDPTQFPGPGPNDSIYQGNSKSKPSDAQGQKTQSNMKNEQKEFYVKRKSGINQILRIVTASTQGCIMELRKRPIITDTDRKKLQLEMQFMKSLEETEKQLKQSRLEVFSVRRFGNLKRKADDESDSDGRDSKWRKILKRFEKYDLNVV